ncbi:hypothetical protein [uncultured Alcanivorax sp.]|uniref:hypothetical protein n=1 Tax=uncultured Alcanivorax sp. TaxID=191215 RepID=UPI0030D8B980
MDNPVYLQQARKERYPSDLTLAGFQPGTHPFCKVLGGIQTPPKPRFDVSTPESLSLRGVIQKLQALPLSETAPVSIVIGTFIVCRPAVFKEPGSVNHKETGRN